MRVGFVPLRAARALLGAGVLALTGRMTILRLVAHPRGREEGSRSFLKKRTKKRLSCVGAGRVCGLIDRSDLRENGVRVGWNRHRGGFKIPPAGMIGIALAKFFEQSNDLG